MYDGYETDDVWMYGGGEEASVVDYLRLAIGLIARGIFWLCLLFILGNAIAQAVHEKAYLLGFVELSAFPITVLLYPFVHHAEAYAWPLATGTSFLPAFIAMIVAYPVSTIVGGLPPIDR